MLKLLPQLPTGSPLSLLCVGAHSDDLEIGCGGTVLDWLDRFPSVDVCWVVLSGVAERSEEASASAESMLNAATEKRIVLGTFRDGFMPSEYVQIKSFFELLKSQFEPDIVLTHRLEDRHQDHRLAAELTWNTWRDHLIVEYEIPKYEGDLGQPNAYSHVSEKSALRKAEHLDRHFASQRSKGWFNRDNFVGLMRLRGMECRSPSGFAEAFHIRKLVL